MMDEYDHLEMLQTDLMASDIGEVNRIVPLPAMAARTLPVTFRGAVPPATITGQGGQSAVELISRPTGGLPVGWEGPATTQRGVVGYTARNVKWGKGLPPSSSLLPL
jgi:hypothetical protein